MKKTFLIPVFVAFTLVACTPADTTNNGSASSSSDASSVTLDLSSASSIATSSVAATTSSAAATEAKVVTMTVENWKFAPTQVSFKVGQKATIRLSDLTGIHGFAVNDLGINVRLNPGDTQDIVIPTDKPGTYTFYCSVPCGPGHKSMQGTIVIS